MSTGKIYLGTSVALMAGCVMAALQPTDGMADPAEFAINDGRIIKFANPLPRMKCGKIKCGTYNNPELSLPGLLTTSDPELGMFLQKMRETIMANRRLLFIDGKVVVCNHNWIRDHVQQMKGWMHWEYDPLSFLQLIIDTQRRDGQFFELVKQMDDRHWAMVDEDCRVLCARCSGTSVFHDFDRRVLEHCTENHCVGNDANVGASTNKANALDAFLAELCELFLALEGAVRIEGVVAEEVLRPAKVAERRLLDTSSVSVVERLLDGFFELPAFRALDAVFRKNAFESLLEVCAMGVHRVEHVALPFTDFYDYGTDDCLGVSVCKRTVDEVLLHVDNDEVFFWIHFLVLVKEFDGA